MGGGDEALGGIGDRRLTEVDGGEEIGGEGVVYDSGTGIGDRLAVLIPGVLTGSEALGLGTACEKLCECGCDALRATEPVLVSLSLRVRYG